MSPLLLRELSRAMRTHTVEPREYAAVADALHELARIYENWPDVPKALKMADALTGAAQERE